MKLPEQQISSARTSVRQIPTVFRRLPKKMGAVNADIGGGRFDDATMYLQQFGVCNFVWDPYNRSEEHNNATLGAVFGHAADTVTCANVLNVILEPAARAFVIDLCAKCVKLEGTVFFQIYEGNKSSISRITSKGYQHNKPALRFAREVERYFAMVRVTGNIIVASLPIINSR